MSRVSIDMFENSVAGKFRVAKTGTGSEGYVDTFDTGVFDASIAPCFKLMYSVPPWKLTLVGGHLSAIAYCSL